ncbi:MAG: diguanylate cyclase domain-containing protein, partial [Methylophagaceae bacterium]
MRIPTHTLKFRLIILTVLVEIVMLSILISNNLRLVESQTLKGVQSNVLLTQQLFQHSTGSFLFERDFIAVEDALNAIINNNELYAPVINVQIFDTDGNLFGRAGSKVDPALLQNNAENIDFSLPYLHTKHTLNLSGIEVGGMEFIISLENIIKFRANLLSQTIAIALIEIVISILVLILMASYLTKNLGYLIQATEQISHQDYDLNLNINSNDEIAQLAASMHEMSREIQLSQQSLKDSLLISHQEQARLRSLLTSMNMGILYENLDGEVDYFNPAFTRIWTIADDVIYAGMKTKEVLTHSSNIISHADHFSKHILAVEKTNEISESFEIMTADGRTINQLSYPVIDESKRIMGRIWIYEDVTRQKQTAEQLLYLAERDHLTGLYNRRKFQQQLDAMIQSFQRNNQQFALLFFDLDEFKYINDSYGHRAGDTALIRIGGELSKIMRSDGILSRLGGDEFGVLSPISHESESLDLANRITKTIASLPFRFEGQNIRLTASVGITIFPEHGMTSDELVIKADTAMYAAKQRGKNTARMFDPSMFDPSDLSSHLTWNERVVNALDEDKFVLHYQEVRNIQSGTTSHYELLIRMTDDNHPDQLIMPDKFIPMAEKSGKILLIDQWVVKKTIHLLADNPDIPSLALNISGRSLDEPTLGHIIDNLLREKSVDPKRLVIELTETAAVSDLADAQRFIAEMHRIGCQVY